MRLSRVDVPPPRKEEGSGQSSMGVGDQMGPSWVRFSLLRANDMAFNGSRGLRGCPGNLAGVYLLIP